MGFLGRVMGYGLGGKVSGKVGFGCQVTGAVGRC